MIFKKVFVATILSLFVWQSVADAASISTRVRILESKVAKQDKQIKASEQSQKNSEAKVDKSLAKMQALEKKLSKLLKEDGKEKTAERADKRYAFP
ncbi:hypothetical protein THMIRHAM_07400 [Thiomicrorhabdus immobilis]|uniref:Uncharacterized protein n=1 Tax=Thiomicrorhabdus immobilis TaxID=2791037 RepID=A0ABM7MC94_9GAMM|nr:hypothetical protein [Thiomicrorhabdus immobilis]BCN92955.1 hypothetical protein THMIRHAM_07400 [Thiomicrorhabdus immobilis]